MKRILTTLLLFSALLLTVAAQENKPEPGTLMLNKDFSPTALEPGELFYYPVLLHCVAMTWWGHSCSSSHLLS
jgi:hypothetical protein